MDQGTKTPPESGYTRAKILKRAGIGAAAAWSVPLFVTTSTAAAAVKRTKCVDSAFANGLDTVCDTCIDDSINTNLCGDDSNCFCLQGASGCCECVGLGAACSQPPCTKNKDCPRGHKCVLTCCDGGGAARGGRCLPPCNPTEAPPSEAATQQVLSA